MFTFESETDQGCQFSNWPDPDPVPTPVTRGWYSLLSNPKVKWLFLKVKVNGNYSGPNSRCRTHAITVLIHSFDSVFK